jgi:hypothetical protein
LFLIETWNISNFFYHHENINLSHVIAYFWLTKTPYFFCLLLISITAFWHKKIALWFGLWAFPYFLITAYHVFIKSHGFFVGFYAWLDYMRAASGLLALFCTLILLGFNVYHYRCTKNNA